MINETLARLYWPDRDPIGQHVSFIGDSVKRQIVSIVRIVNYNEVGEAPQPCVYLPLAQNFADGVVLYVRTNADPAPVLATVQREMRDIDPRLDVGDARTARRVIDQAPISKFLHGVSPADPALRQRDGGPPGGGGAGLLRARAPCEPPRPRDPAQASSARFLVQGTVLVRLIASQATY
jgi:hypothetical protein